MSRRFLVPTSGWNGDVLTFPPEEAHHLRHVLRLRRGDQVQVFDGAGREVTATVIEISSEGVKAHIETQLESKPAPGIRVIVGQGLPRGGKLEEILERSTELGLSHLIPVITHRSVSRPDEERGETKVLRWRKVAIAAAKQCGRADVPQVDAPTRLANFLQTFQQDPGALGLVAWEDDKVHTLRGVLPAQSPAAVWILIGPEGGLTPEEVHLCQSAGFISVGLGPRILRTETAGPALLAIVQHLYGDIT